MDHDHQHPQCRGQWCPLSDVLLMNADILTRATSSPVPQSDRIGTPRAMPRSPVGTVEEYDFTEKPRTSGMHEKETHHRGNFPFNLTTLI